MRRSSARMFFWIGLCLLLLSSPAWALRCRSTLIQEGDLRYLVVEKCGEPKSWDLVGYRLNANGDREYKIEHLLYGPRDGGWYDLVEVVGGRVSKIESIKE